MLALKRCPQHADAGARPHGLAGHAGLRSRQGALTDRQTSRAVRVQGKAQRLALELLACASETECQGQGRLADRAWAWPGPTCATATARQPRSLQLLLGLLGEPLRHGLVRQQAALRVAELALVAVGALLGVGAGRRLVRAHRGHSQKLVKRGARAAKRVVRGHEPEQGRGRA